MALQIKDYLIQLKELYLRHSLPYTLILCGIVGMLVDIDHLPKVIYLLSGGDSYPNGRSLHLLFLFFAFCVCLYSGAKLSGEFIKYSSLRKKGGGTG